MGRVMFLLGAGSSLGAGLPSTQKITQDVLYRKDIYRHSDSLFYLGSSPEHDHRGRQTIYQVRVLLRLLAAHVDAHNRFQPEKTTNYEDLYYLLDQLERHVDGSVGNPALSPFVNAAVDQLKPILSGHDACKQENSFLHLVGEAKTLIESVAFLSTCSVPSDVGYLSSLLGGIVSGAIPSADVFSLNHDRVLEEFFNGQHRPYVDGFKGGIKAKDSFGRTRPVRVWNPDFDTPADEVRLRIFKLHGSVAWHYNGDDWFIFEDETSYHDMVFDRLGRSRIAIGTHNKPLLYSWSIYSDHLVLFRRALQQATHMFCAGFSFGDALIRNSILQWHGSLDSRRLLVIDPSPDSIESNLSFHQRGTWEASRRSGRITVSETTLEDLDPQIVPGFLAST